MARTRSWQSARKSGSGIAVSPLHRVAAARRSRHDRAIENDPHKIQEGRTMSHPAIAPGRVAVITGGASGIGLAAARKFAAAGMKIVLADLRSDALDRAAAAVAEVAKGGKADVRAV